MVKFLFFYVLLCSTLLFPQIIYNDGIVTGVKTGKKVVALTFDACESVTPAYLDKRIVSFLIDNAVPATLFLGGKFAVRNAAELKRLTNYPWLHFANHSMRHIQHSEKLSQADLLAEVTRADSVIYSITGRHTRHFRFPAGNYNARAVQLVKVAGYTIVHWSFASGDPVKNVPAEQLLSYVKSKITPGCILIFHINGRGYKTADILPGLYKFLKNKGYSIVSLEDMLRGQK